MPRTLLVVSVGVLVSVGLLAGCKTKYADLPQDTDTNGDDDDTAPPTDTKPDPVRFNPHVIDTLPGPTWATVGDIDGDGVQGIVVSALGELTSYAVPPGVVEMYSLGSSFDDWVKTDLVTPSAGVEYPNQPTLGDVDGDGEIDVLLPSGGHFCDKLEAPCGSLRWLRNNGGGSFSPQVLFDDAPIFYTGAALGDVDGDGIADIVAAAEYDPGSQSQIHVFKGRGGGAFDQTPVVVGDGGGTLPSLGDVDGDGDLDILSGETFDTGTSFWWYQSQGGAWVPHAISTNYGPGWQIGLVNDLYGDGKLRAIGTNHTNTARTTPMPWESAVVSFQVPGDPTKPWPGEVISAGIEAVPDAPKLPLLAPGTWAAGDVDGDGDIDVAVAGSGDPHEYLLQQTGPGQFATRILADDLGLTAGTSIADIDGDGKAEIVLVAARESGVYVVTRK